MKFNLSLLRLILIFVAACYAKNVAKISIDDSAILNLEDKNNGEDLEGRDVKNVESINTILGDSTLLKRDAKNILDTVTFVVDEDSLKENNLRKRAPKNIAHLNLMIDEADLKQSDKLMKRTSKNVVNLDLMVDEDLLLSKLVKRHSENREPLGLDIDVNDFNTRFFVKDDKKFTEITILVKNSDLPSNLISDYRNKEGKHAILVDIPEEITSTLSSGSHQLMMNVKSIKKIVQRKLKSIVIPEMGDIYDETNNLKYTLMPSVKSGTLATALDQEGDISIFATYIRDLTDIYSMCNSVDKFNINAANDAEKMLLLFAPTNKAMIDLSAKPWEFPESITDDDESVVRNNIRHFVESHIAKASTKSFNTEMTVQLVSLNDNKIILKNTDTGFKYRLSDSTEWIPINSIDVLDNGALLSVPKVMSWPGRVQD